jgi:aarF domain-containing kinase
MAYRFAVMVEALHSRDDSKIVEAFQQLGIQLEKMNDKNSMKNIAITMLDTRIVPGYVMSPFAANNGLKENPVVKLPPDLYFIIRSIQLLRGIACAFEIDYSVSDVWIRKAKDTINKLSPSLPTKSYQ